MSNQSPKCPGLDFATIKPSLLRLSAYKTHPLTWERGLAAPLVKGLRFAPIPWDYRP
jgi:hypothetical protein